jgi:peptidoglycan/xylan/chitin deacetylase (PgdA/CDA1 family)
VNTRDKELYLTFDDGPHPQITPWVLQQLQAYNAKATFFCVGENVQKFPEIYAQILAGQHAVGNHSMQHIKGWKVSNQAYLDNIQQASSYIQSNLFRPPYGKIKWSQLRALSKQYKIVMWSLLSRDYDKHLAISESLTAMKLASAGDIIVFHDSEKAFEQLKQLLPPLLAYYQEQGFEMKVLKA